MHNLDDFLTALDFQLSYTDRWVRRFDYPALGEYVITVDTANGTIDYPKPIVLGDHTTSNFEREENFVVLECVCRLLAKGYDPATLILEKRYQVGRGASGGKSDITVLKRAPDPTEQASAPPLLIIECKTFGAEHDKEKLKTEADGGQLFGYFANEHSATHLCIYSSRLMNGAIEYRSDIIHVEDSREAKEKFDKKEKSDNHTIARQAVPLFEHAHNRETLHHTWKTTYGGVFQSTGIFEPEFTPYAIGYMPRRGKDLKEFNGQNGSTRVFNDFMEILRHNNVSDKENAFNRLCTIILAKLVDEGRDLNATLDFQWFPNKDTPEDLIDRLQRLYKRGMKEALGEEITYFEERDIDQAFIAHRRDMARNEVKKIFRALKFYTNNDFAFKEVHNKKLFEQNTQVVREVVELLQDYRLKYTSKQAFLGNLFELLLNSGFKQSEGQFFTPIPIARFIVRCLPLRERMAAALAAGDNAFLPRVMDYACGSAHFLTEIIEELQEDLAALSRPEADSTTWAREHVWGIEKDYRLARTAKIALFLHGAGDANILHDDGLEHANPNLPKPGTVDVLVANPPYSVKDFKQHLHLQNNQFSLLPHLTRNSSEIETLFVERAAQLLTSGGLAGIILPSSILSNSGIYQRTRALLLEKFWLRGIMELGGSAFIATGTNTIILLLERRPDTHSDHFNIRADALFDEEKKPNDADYADSDLLRAYCTAAGLDFAHYCNWLADPQGELPAALEQTPLFIAYQREFDELADTRRRKGQVTFKKLAEHEQVAELRGKFLRHCRNAERSKFYYFALAYVETLEKGELIPQHTTILRGAGDKATEQALLGYKWSQRRGAEGMVNLREPYDGGLLYTPDTTSRAEPPTKAAHHLRRAFLDTEIEDLPEDSPLNGKLRATLTAACFDFTRTTCELNVNLSPPEVSIASVFDTQYPLVALGEIVEIISGGTPNTKIAEYWDGNIPWLSVSDFRNKTRYVEASKKSITEEGLNNSNTQLLNTGDLIISARGTVGEIAQLAISMAFNQSCYGLRGKRGIDNAYLLYVLRLLTDQMKARSSGATFGSITTRIIETLVIPLPPLDVQQQIVQAIEVVEAAEAQARETITMSQMAIENIVTNFEQTETMTTIAELFSINSGRIDPGIEFAGNTFTYIDIGSIENGTGKINFSNIIPAEKAPSRAKRTAQNGSLLISTVRPYLKGFAYIEEVKSDYVFSTGLAILKSKDEAVYATKLLYYLFFYSRSIMKQLEEKMPKSGYPSVNEDDIATIKIALVNPLEQQSLLQEIAQHEARRAEAEATLAAAPAQKRQILLDGLK